MRNSYLILSEILKGRDHLEGPFKGKNNVKTNLKETECENV